MSKVFFKLSGGSFSQDWTNTAALLTSATAVAPATVWDNVPSIMGFKGDGLTSANDVNANLVVADNLTVNLLPNLTSTANTSGAVAEFEIADPVVALQGSGSANPYLAFYMDSTNTQNVRMQLDLRDIDGTTDNAAQQIAIQYRLADSGNWINIPAAYVADASSGPSLATLVTHVDFVLPAAANNQPMLEIRVMTVNATGNDEWIGVDNIVISGQAITTGPDTTAPTIAAASPADNTSGVSPTAALTVTFSEAVKLGTGNITLTDGAGDVRTIAVTDTTQVSLSGQVLTIHPSASLNTSSTYHLTLPSGAVLDLAGNAFAGNAANPIDFGTTLKLTGIYDIQGAGHTSALVGQIVHTSGVVTAIDTTGNKGYWIQDAAGDGNLATSDAIFVSSATITVAVGDKVDLQGVVEESTNVGTDANNLTVTQLNSVQNLTIVSHGNTVAPTVIGAGGLLPPTSVIDSDHFGAFNPTHDAIDFYESVEGMLLTVKNVAVVSNSVSGATFVVADNGVGATGINDRGGLTNSLGDVNPERFQIYADTGVTTGITGTYTTGDHIGDVTGVMSYYNANYELLPTVLPAAAVHNAAMRETTTLKGDATHVSIGAYNLSALAVGDSQAKYDALAHDIVANLGNPDLLGLEGVLDNNGAATGDLGADLTINKLIDAIVAAGGPHYQYAQVDPSADNVAGTNARSVVLYNAERVQYVEESARLVDDNTPANGDSFDGAAQPLAADFVFRGETVTYVAVDNASRAGAVEMYGKDQSGAVPGDAVRADQIASVQAFVTEVEQSHPGNHVVVAGNFNSYQFDTTMTALASGAGLVNLTNTLAATDRYTSAYEGNNSQLDHVLVSSGLAAGAAFDDVHINTNLAANSTQSDRDPVLGTFYVNSAPVAVADAFDLKEDTALTVNALQGVLANDTDVNADTLSVTLVTGAAHGTLALNADGSFNYTPLANYNGADSFSYRVNDGHSANSGVATVLLTVGAVNDAPLLVADAASAVLVEAGQAGVGVDSAVVHLHTGDIDSANLAFGNDGWLALGDGLFSQDGQYGTAVLDINALTVTYQLDNGLGDTDMLAAGQLVHEQFTVSLSDGATTVSVPVGFDIQGSNDAPFGKGDHAAAVEDSSVLINVLANDGDVEGNALTIVLDAGKSALGGSLTLENGQVRYAADADAFDLMAANTSAIDHFSYHLDDGHGGVSGPISVQVTVQEAGDNISLVGGAGSDTFRAALGVDTTYDGGAGNDKIYGNSGADILLGGDGNDAIDGGAGNDVIAGGVGNDNLIGGDGNDMVDGGAGNDGLNGGNGDDYLDGGIGDDALQGGAGSDHLVGNSGNDALLGGKGNDLLEGGSGNDLFVFSALSGRDTIVDFNPGEDTILTGYAEGGALGNPTTWATTIHNAAVTTPATPWAFANFDADGNGAADSVIITGGNLGADSVVLAGWSIATLVGQHYLDPNGQAAIGGWLH